MRVRRVVAVRVLNHADVKRSRWMRDLTHTVEHVTSTPPAHNGAAYRWPVLSTKTVRVLDIVAAVCPHTKGSVWWTCYVE